jgi:hypothetical protein
MRKDGRWACLVLDHDEDWIITHADASSCTAGKQDKMIINRPISSAVVLEVIALISLVMVPVCATNRIRDRHLSSLLLFPKTTFKFEVQKICFLKK